MSDFLTRVVSRSLGAGDVLQPRVPSVYEPYGRAGGILAPKLGCAAQEVSQESIEGRTESRVGSPPADDRIGPSEATAPSRLPKESEQRNTILAAGTIPRRSTAVVSPPPFEPGITDGPRQSMSTRTGWPTPILLPRQTQPPEAAVQAAPDGSARRPPRRPEGRIDPPTVNRFASRATQPAFQVAIGRVEVRAIVHELPARPNPPAQTRSTVSLDDYLSRRHRGQR